MKLTNKLEVDGARPSITPTDRLHESFLHADKRMHLRFAPCRSSPLRSSLELTLQTCFWMLVRRHIWMRHMPAMMLEWLHRWLLALAPHKRGGHCIKGVFWPVFQAACSQEESSPQNQGKDFWIWDKLVGTSAIEQVSTCITSVTVIQWKSRDEEPFPAR